MKWEEVIQATYAAQRLDYVPRYTSVPVTVTENVSTHSFWVTFYSFLIHNEVTSEEPITLAACLSRAMIHDFIEHESGDFVRTFKYLTPQLRQAIEEAEDLAISKLHGKLQAAYDKSQKLEALSGRQSYIKSVVKAADFLSLFRFMYRELSRGNREILPFYRRMMDDIQLMKSENGDVRHELSGGIFEPRDFYTTLLDFAQAQYRGHVKV